MIESKLSEISANIKKNGDIEMFGRWDINNPSFCKHLIRITGANGGKVFATLGAEFKDGELVKLMRVEVVYPEDQLQSVYLKIEMNSDEQLTTSM